MMKHSSDLSCIRLKTFCINLGRMPATNLIDGNTSNDQHFSQYLDTGNGLQDKSKLGPFQTTPAKHQLEYFYRVRKALERISEFRRTKNTTTLKREKHRKYNANGGSSIFGCEHCSAKFSSSALAKRHAFSHSQYTTPAQPALRRYSSARQNEKYHTCFFCYKNFKTVFGLHLHNQKHGGYVKTFFCNHCAASFTRKDLCARHVKTHVGQRSCCCQVCLLKFNNDYELTVHERRHIPQKSHRCRHCGAKFRTKVVCERHELAHYGERSHVCRICSKKEVSGVALMVHQRVHSTTDEIFCQKTAKQLRGVKHVGKNAGTDLLHPLPRVD